MTPRRTLRVPGLGRTDWIVGDCTAVWSVPIGLELHVEGTGLRSACGGHCVAGEGRGGGGGCPADVLGGGVCLGGGSAAGGAGRDGDGGSGLGAGGACPGGGCAGGVGGFGHGGVVGACDGGSVPPG